MSDQTLAEYLTSVEFFSAFTSTEIEALAGLAEIQTCGFGDAIFDAGEPAHGLYVIRKGMVRIFTDEGGKEISMGVLRAGDVFAEIAVLREYRHESSARASAPTELVFIPREAFGPVLEQNLEAADLVARSAAISTAGGLISRLFDLRGKIEVGEREELIRSVGLKRVEDGQRVISQGDREDRRLYVVRRGQINLVENRDGADVTLMTLSHGDAFGEATCLTGQAQPVSAVAVGEATLLVIPEQTVRFLLARNPKLREVLEQRSSFLTQEIERHRKLAERARQPLLLDLGSRPRPGERVIRRFPLVEQAEEMDCGAACLAMICKHYGLSLTLGKLREMANVTAEGATLESLARVGESLGFTTRGVKCTFEALRGFELPLIAHWKGYHFTVVYGVSKRHVWLADPAMGFRKMPLEEFERGWTGTCLLFTPGAEMVEQATSRSPWVRFIRFLKPHTPILGHMVLATLIIEALGVAPPIIIQNILDRVVVHHDFELLQLLIVGLILASVFTQLTALLRTFLANFMVRNLDFAMMSQFFKHTLSLPIAFFAKRRTGDVFARFQENTTIRQFLTESTVSTFLNVLMIFVYFIVLFLYSVKMTLLLIAMVVPLAVLTVAVTPKIKNYARRNFEASTDAEAVLMETISAAETVKATGSERDMRLKWEKKYAHALNVQYRSERFDALVGLAGQLLSAATTVVILWTGANLVLTQQLSIGQLIAFNMLMGSVMAPLMGLIGLWDELHEAGVAMERLGDVLDLEPEQKPEDFPSRIVLPEARGDVRFEGVYFRYGGTETPYVLENVSFELKAGETVAIVGHSGSGKTTLARLLVGFHEPNEGRILIDGYDLNQLDKESYRRQLGYVMQNNVVFSGTISENIALGDENPDRRRIIDAAKAADAHGFINKLPLGYEQTVGERGVGLSGGQIQRLCIARALYRDPRIVIFDEATSALDTQSEANILRNMEGLLKGRTAVIIAHRLSTVMNADKILVLYDGNVVEQGVHEELIDRKGMYYQLVQKQIARAS